MMDADFDLLAWIATGTIATRDVVLYNDHEAIGEYQAVMAELDALADRAATGGPAVDEPIGSDPTADRTAELAARADALADRLMAARATWTVRALSREELHTAFDANEYPLPPTAPRAGADQATQAAHAKAVATYVRNKMAVDERRKHELIAIAVQSVTTTAGTKTGVTAAELATLAGMPHGGQWLDALYRAVDAATAEDVAPDFPSLPATSMSGPA